MYIPLHSLPFQALGDAAAVDSVIWSFKPQDRGEILRIDTYIYIYIYIHKYVYIYIYIYTYTYLY